MFSTLLSRPKNAPYDPSYHFLPSKKQQEPQPNNVPSQYDTTVPLKKRFPDLVHNFPKPQLDQELINQTKAVIDSILNTTEPSQKDTNYINYENQVGGEAQVIQIRTLEEDPMLPPKHKLRKNRHERVEEDVTIVKDTNTKKLSKADSDYWNIPAAVSNWKNSQGFTIGLEKRMIGREHGGSEMNIQKFGDLSSALNDADRAAREELKKRNELKLEQERKEKRLREERLKQMNADRYKRRKY
ncbi:PRP45 Pre-mRNA-processing protein 45 [Candida maltosa Xu316]